MQQDTVQRVFDFYCKQQYIQGQFATFERQQYEATIFTIGKWMHFCRDFKIFQDKYLAMEIFKKHATNMKELNYEQFINILISLGKSENKDLNQYLSDLGLDNWLICKEKMKPFQKPFQMKDNKERIQEVKYEFKMFHPELKDHQIIKQILERRKQQNYYIKHQEREKKEFHKLQFQLKHFTKQQLQEKYPNLNHLIQKLPNPSKPTTCSYQSKDFRKSLTTSQHRESALTWESLNHLPVPSDFIQNLVDDEDDQFLREYQIENNKQIETNLKKRSLSDYTQIKDDGGRIKVRNILKKDYPQIHYVEQQKIRYKIQERQQMLQLNQQNYSVELPRNYMNQDDSFKKSVSPNKLNISMLRRVQEISGLEAIKEKNLLNQIVSQQREKEKIQSQKQPK